MKPADIHVNSVPECAIFRPKIYAKVDILRPAVPESSGYRIAGHATDVSGTNVRINLLRSDTEYGKNADVTLELERATSPDQVRPWAEKVAAALVLG